MKKQRQIVFAIAAILLLLTGCGRGAGTVRLADVVPITTDTLTTLLLGDPDVSPTRLAPADKALLQTGTYENVVIAADGPGFARVSKGVLSVADVNDLLKSVVSKINGRLKKRGFSAQQGTFPPTTTGDRTLIATLTPQTQVTGSEADQKKGHAKTLVLVRLTITDPATNTVLAQRDYYSGNDAKTGK